MTTDTLMLLPGLLCDQTVWTPQLATLARRYDCRVADYGDADSLQRMAEAVLDTAPRRFALAGHSMGGRVALEILRHWPAMVERLALLDTGYEARPSGEAGEREREKRLHLVALAQARGMRAMGAEWLNGMVHPERLHDPALRGVILDMVAHKSTATYEAQIRALLARPDATAVLTAITCPTDVICGRQDSWSPLSRHERMAQLIPGSRLVVIEHCGHMSTLEQPAAVLAALQDWLGRDTAAP